MSTDRYQRLHKKIDHSIRERYKRDALYDAMRRGRNERAKRLALLPEGEKLFDETREVKERCIERQDELVQRFVANARERGSIVFEAKDGPDAIEYILSVVQKHQAKSVIKAKSLTSEEIEVNHPLEEAGMEVVETDLGELIIQKSHEKSFHLVFPAVHKTLQETTELFRKVIGKDIPADCQEVMKAVRGYLRPIFLNADIGLTGANIGIADTGTIAIETNEGNARLVTGVPDVHICIIGIEKIVESFDDALKLCLAHPVSSVGQILTTYVTFMGGRSPLNNGDSAPREQHIVVLDNGRRRMRQDPAFREALYCIRCGACMNVCPSYGVVGGHVFGYIYPGPIGIPWTAQVHGLENAGDFASLCISCGLCKEICPAKIDIPMMIAEVKYRDSKTHPQPTVNRVVMGAELISKLGSATAPVTNWFLKNRAFRRVLENTAGIEKRRELPSFSGKTFTQWFRARTAESGAPKPPDRRVAYFVDLYANYNDPDLGKMVVHCLERCGCQVVVPPQKASGYPYVGYGDLAKARSTAEYNVRELAKCVDDHCDIIATEPTAACCLVETYPSLLRHNKDAAKVADHSMEFFSYLLSLDEDVLHDLFEVLRGSLEGKRIGFHISCHQRPLSDGESAMEFLRRCGAHVERIETGTCCGIAGTFGMKKGPLGYELSQAIGEPLFKLFKEADIDTIATESSVCRMHIQEGTGKTVHHPLELVKSVLLSAD